MFTESYAPIVPFSPEVLDAVVDRLPEPVRGFARYWLPVAVWASAWSVPSADFTIVVSLSDGTLGDCDVLDGSRADFEAHRCQTRELDPPRTRWSQALQRVGQGWVPSAEPIEGPVLHILVPPDLPDGGFWARTTAGGRDLVFGRFTGHEAPRHHDEWVEDGGYPHLLIRSGVAPDAALSALRQVA